MATNAVVRFVFVALATEPALTGAAGGAVDQRQHLGGVGIAGGREPARAERVDGKAG